MVSFGGHFVQGEPFVEVMLAIQKIWLEGFRRRVFWINQGARDEKAMYLIWIIAETLVDDGMAV